MNTGGTWRVRAACAVPGVDPEVFYPVDTGTAGAVLIARAKRVCAGCPVRSACLADVMAAEDPAQRWGVTGGLSADERAVLFARDHMVPVAGVQLGLFDLPARTAA